MSDVATFGLIRAAVYFPALVLTLFLLLWMLAFFSSSPKAPGYFSSRLRLASWLAFSWQVLVYTLDVRSKGRVLAMFQESFLPAPAVQLFDYAALEEAMKAQLLGSLVLHAALLAVLHAARRRPSPAA